ncbi:MAG: CHASE2 domain-containing protein [Gammaproteobacteria bacterium]
MGALLVGLTLLLVQQDWLWRLDRLFYDSHLAFTFRPAPEDVLIVAIDESSLAALGRWPWSRRVHAELLQRLADAGARVIALNILTAELDPQDGEGDRLLAEALRGNGRTVLPLIVEQPHHGGQLVETLPLPMLAVAAAGIGHVQAEFDGDGMVRGLFLKEGLGTPHWPTLAVALLQVAEPGKWDVLPGERDPAPLRDAPQMLTRDHYMLVPFAGPPGHYPRISYHRVLAGDFPPGLFQDKYVLVGVTTSGLGDGLPTPVSGRSQPMPGVEFSANVLDALRLGLVIEPVSRRWQMLISAGLVLLPVWLYSYFAPRWNLLLAVLLMVGGLGWSLILLRVGKLWFPPAPVLVAFAISYPLWSWRRLGLAMHYLDSELAVLRAEQPVTGAADFEATMTYLARLLPMGGWQLRDDAGRCVKAWGQPLSPAPRSALAGNWLHHGQDWWRGLSAYGALWQVGVRWHDAKPPGPQQRLLLIEIAYGLARRSDREPVGTEELIHARIAQVREATARLRAMRRFVTESVAHMPDGVLVVSSLGQVLLANAQAARYLCGDPECALEGRPLWPLLAHDAAQESDRWVRALRRVVFEQRTVHGELRGHGGADLMMQMSPLTRERRPAALIVNLSDVSALKRSERRRSEFLGFLSHDLRSPLVSVLALLELAKESRSPAEIEDLLRRIGAYTNRTLALAEQFLRLAQAEGEGSDDSLQDVELVTVALNAFEQVWLQAQTKQIELRRQFDVDEAWVQGDPSLLERAIVNLLTNAIQHNPPRSHVQLWLHVGGKELWCCVTDDGRGIPQEYLPRLFDRFERVVHPDVAAEAGGAGLGLAIVKAVADRHGGRVEVESCVGEGSRFCLILGLGAEQGLPA